MNCRALLVSGFSGLFVCFAGSQIKAADTPAAGPVDQAIIYFSYAPWDGAAYDIEIPLQHRMMPSNLHPHKHMGLSSVSWSRRPFIFRGRKMLGEDPQRGDGRALFQANLNKSMPEWLEGSVSFKTLRGDHPVSGTYEFATLDGKGSLRAVFRRRGATNRRGSSGDMFLLATLPSHALWPRGDGGRYWVRTSVWNSWITRSVNKVQEQVTGRRTTSRALIR
jgi:hypothetical protein